MPEKAHFTRRLATAFRIYAFALFLSINFSGHGLATPVPVTCDPKTGIWDFGLEWIADTCVSKEMTDNTVTHYSNNYVTCDQSAKKVALFAYYGDTTASPAQIINYVASQGYRVFRNKEGTHIVAVHRYYTGLIDGKDMTAYAPGLVATDVFKQGFILPPTPVCKKIPDCKTCPCPDELAAGSSVNVGSGRLSHNQEIFSAKGGQLPLSFSLYYQSQPFAPSSIGNGWSHSYEQSLQILANGTAVFWNEGKERNYRLYNGAYQAPRADYSTLIKNADASYTLTEKYGLIRNFDTSGRITTLSDRNGNSTAFSYTSGKLTSVTDSAGRSAALGYDTTGKLSVITDPMGRQHTLTYASGLLKSLLAPDGGSWNYLYNNSNMLTTKTDPSGSSTTYTYDTNNRVTSAVDPQSQTRSFGFSGSAGSQGKVPDPYPICSNEGIGYTIIDDILQATGSCMITVVPVTDKNGGGWKYEYEYMSESVKSITDPYSNKTSYTHDNRGNLMSKNEPGIGRTSYTYDTAGNITTIKDPLGNITSYTYNNLNQVLTINSPQGNSSNTYDAKGNLTSSTDTAGATTVYEYDAKGNVTRITNAKGQVTTMTYNTAGQLESSADPTGITTSLTYDFTGNLLTNNGPSGTTTFVYDAMNRLTRITDPLGNFTSYSYDKQGNRISQTDANGNSATFKYNYQGQVTETRDVLGSAASYTYGATGGGSCPSCSGGVDKLTSLSDAKNQTTSYQYDLLGRLTKETDPLGKTTSYSYDAAGNMVSRTDANGITINYSYDALRRLTRKSYPDGTAENYTYDPAGRILTTSNKDISYSYIYDISGRLIKINDNRNYSLDYEYDILGTRTRTTLQKGTPDEQITSYGYDSANRPAMTTSKAGIFTYSYDSQGRRSSTTYPNGVTTSYTYDTLSRLTGIRHAAGQTTIAFANYSDFDKVGNRKSKITNAGIENYNYDATYRLTQAATPKGTENYSYDAVGNRLTGPGPKDTRYQYNAANQAIMGRIYGHDYDGSGNQTSRITPNATDKSWTNSWDYENRLIKSEQTKGQEKRTTIFKYDPLGRRIQKQLTTTIKGITKTATWQYIYDGENISAEIFTNETGVTEKTYYTHGAGTDEHLALERNNNKYYYHADGLGSITTITDCNKNVVQSYSYDSFGVVRPMTNFRNSYTYTGREWDRETGLYYYRARYYDPMEGRFISRDPIGFEGGINLYAYVDNNPVNWVDPFGESALPPMPKPPPTIPTIPPPPRPPIKPPKPPGTGCSAMFRVCMAFCTSRCPGGLIGKGACAAACTAAWVACVTTGN